MAEFGSNSANSVARGQGFRLGEIDDSCCFWHSSTRCILPSWMCLTTGRRTRCKRLLDSRWPSHNRHQGPVGGADHVAYWFAGLGAPWSWSGETSTTSGDPATLLVRKSKSRRARTVRLHPELVQLFTNWPANRSPRDKVVSAQHADVPSGTSGTGSNARAWVRSRLGPGGGVLALTV